ncbi:MAG TPA: biliverdin-producing heme oxygenase [Kofleriaceae bacterium]|nr:biliverdin-producing heme oxygenase [Kofleriaceae bacterium]
MRDSLSMLERLDLETKIHHGPADSARVALLGKPTRERYADYLARTYAFEAPAEWRWIRTPGLDTLIDVSPRLFAPVLAKDLATLGRFPDVYEPSSFKGVAQALGWMYVVERGRLMNAMLHRHLVRRLPFESSIAGTYMAGSSSLGLRWQQLGAALEGISKNPVMVTQVVNGALEAFRVMRHPAPHNTPQQKAA